MDDDKRQLRLYQEQYLADGDLHNDGPGRARRFRWKNIGEFQSIFWSAIWIWRFSISAGVSISCVLVSDYLNEMLWGKRKLNHSDYIKTI